MKELQGATIKLEQAGVKNTDWMFERDSKDNLTGNYISEINQGLFKEKVRKCSSLSMRSMVRIL